MPIHFPAKFDVNASVDLKTFTSIKVGGPALYLAKSGDQDVFAELFRFAKSRNLRFLCLGHGTNVFFPQTGFPGLVVVIDFRRIDYDGDKRISIEAGASLKELNMTCQKYSLTGCEFTSGIPGTVGGAIYGNAGAYGSAVSDKLVEAKILTTDGQINTVGKKYFQFDYRHSFLKKSHEIVLQATFEFQKDDPETIKNKVFEILEMRRKKLPSRDVFTAGSYFKNLVKSDGSREAAAIYLDAIGSKETLVGDAAVFHNHANILINKGNAAAQDILQLEEILKDRVFERFGIRLEREVMFIE